MPGRSHSVGGYPKAVRDQGFSDTLGKGREGSRGAGEETDDAPPSVPFLGSPRPDPLASGTSEGLNLDPPHPPPRTRGRHRQDTSNNLHSFRI